MGGCSTVRTIAVLSGVAAATCLHSSFPLGAVAILNAKRDFRTPIDGLHELSWLSGSSAFR